MIPGISGSLLSHDVLADIVPRVLGGLLGEKEREHVRARLRSWHQGLAASLGPSVAARGLFDRVAEPLMTALGYEVATVESTADRLRAILGVAGSPRATLLVTSWGQPASAAWRDAVRLGIAQNGRWCFCLTGPRVRLVDAARTYSRQYVEIDLDAALEHDTTFAVLWGLLRSEAMAGTAGDATPLLDRAIALTETHRASVRACLQHGVHDALAELSRALAAAAKRNGRLDEGKASTVAISAFDEALIVVYRVLFLLFAEARGLVPKWHPTYRDGYTIESLRAPVETAVRPVGVWESLQAIARLAHHGCRAGTLTVPPFNGRLFSPSHAPLADRVPLDELVVRRALLALTTRRGRGGRERIAYSDLGVEQLGSVYERLLDFDPAGTNARAPAGGLARSERRKATGAFYTPRPLTEYIVRRTLAPLTEHAAPEEILRLRVLDPAMGSGAFLVAACRYLASAYEAALLRGGGWSADDITEQERVSFRRTIAQRCLYGVDVNPMAVQLGRLSLWLATLSSDRPLTFLDHRLRTGNSLVGTSVGDLARQPGGRQRRKAGALPLFDDACDSALRDAADVRLRIAVEPGDTLEQVRAKETAFNALASAQSVLGRWRAVCDCWCGAWFGEPGHARLPVPFTALADHLLGRGQLPEQTAGPLVAASRAVAARERFFHWPLEFPEVFQADSAGDPAATGFDAIIGNPPWEMLRGDRGDAETRAAARTAAARLTGFTRGSGFYPLQGTGHANLYQLFLERSLSLVKDGGRLGLVLPSGLGSDAGAAGLRRAMFDRTGIDSLVSLDNRDGIFPVHRSLRILLFTATTGRRTAVLPCRVGVADRDAIDRLPESGADPEAVLLPRLLLDKLGGGDLAIPKVQGARDLDILHAVTFSLPAIGDRDGWHIRFGRELNATDDRRHFHRASRGLPIIEGKHLMPFTVNASAAGLRIDRDLAATLVDPGRTFARRRLAYREVASATNRLTLIAAVLPAGTITTHTVSCLKDDLDDESQDYLCGVLNSFVANYLVRMRVNTHVSSGIIDRLPVPVPCHDDPRFREIAGLSRSIAAAARGGTAHAATADARARLQALTARSYALRPSHFEHILATFPLVPRNERDRAMSAYYDIVP